MVVPSGRSGSGSPGAGCASFRAWATGIGGADADETTFKLVLQSQANAPTYVAGVRAHVLSKGRPIRGAVVRCPAQGVVTERSVLIDLDRSGDGRYVRSGHRQPFGFTLRRGESEIFKISAGTRAHAVRWLLEVDVVTDGEHRLVTVRNNMRPFLTSAIDPRAGVYQWNYADAWIVASANPNQPDRAVRVGQKLRSSGTHRDSPRHGVDANRERAR
jgi:hypothetical protein